MDAFMMKPLGLPELLETMRRLLDKMAEKFSTIQHFKAQDPAFGKELPVSLAHSHQ